MGFTFGLLITFACLGGMILFQKFVMLPGAYPPMYDQFVNVYQHRNEIGIGNLILWTVLLFVVPLVGGLLLGLIERHRSEVQQEWMVQDQAQERSQR